MDEWQAKYEVLRMQISDPEIIDNAERLVKIANELSITTMIPLYECWYYLIETISTLSVIDANKYPKLNLGPILKGDLNDF
jgi:hypothetical protein